MRSKRKEKQKLAEVTPAQKVSRIAGTNYANKVARKQAANAKAK